MWSCLPRPSLFAEMLHAALLSSPLAQGFQLGRMFFCEGHLLFRFLLPRQVLLRSGSEVVQLLVRHREHPLVSGLEFFRVMLRDRHGLTLLDRERGHGWLVEDFERQVHQLRRNIGARGMQLHDVQPGGET